MAVSSMPVTVCPSISQCGSRNLSFVPWMIELPALMLSSPSISFVKALNPSNSGTVFFAVVVSSFNIFVAPLFAGCSGGPPHWVGNLGDDPADDLECGQRFAWERVVNRG